MHWIPAILILPYFCMLLWFYRSLLKIKPFIVTSEPVTFVSVVIACKNEQLNLPVLLNNIANQNYPGELFEVIIVDDNSIDRTFEIASGFSGLKNRIVLSNGGYGKKLAILTGVKVASGRLIITTDGDCRMGKDWIRTIAGFYEKHKPDMIICPVQLDQQVGFFGRFQELEFLSLQGITAASVLSGEASMCNGANLSFTKEAYLRHSDNLHNEISSGDDIFLLHSLKREMNSKILWLESPNSLVTAASTTTTGYFLRQRSRWISKWKVYSDRFTIFLGIVTFVTIIIQIAVYLVLLTHPLFIDVFLVIIFLKMFPDFLILLNTTRRYGRNKLMNWFFPSQIVYPFYALFVIFCSLIYRNSWNTNFPSQKEI